MKEGSETLRMHSLKWENPVKQLTCTYTNRTGLQLCGSLTCVTLPLCPMSWWVGSRSWHWKLKFTHNCHFSTNHHVLGNYFVWICFQRKKCLPLWIFFDVCPHQALTSSLGQNAGCSSTTADEEERARQSRGTSLKGVYFDFFCLIGFLKLDVLLWDLLCLLFFHCSPPYCGENMLVEKVQNA